MHRLLGHSAVLVLFLGIVIGYPAPGLSNGFMDASQLNFTKKAVEGGVAVDKIDDPAAITGGIVDDGSLVNQDQLDAAIQNQVQQAMQNQVQSANANIDGNVQVNGQKQSKVVVFQQGTPQINEELIVFNEEIIGDVIDDPSAQNNNSGSNTQTNTVGNVTANLNISAAATAANESGPGSVVTFSASISNVQDSVLVNVGQFNLSLSDSSISNNEINN